MMRVYLAFRGIIATILVASVGFVFADAVSAERFTSPNYTIDASVAGNSFGGQGSSSSYKLVSSGGESIIGEGTGGSYKLAGGYVAQLEQSTPSMQLTVQPSGLAAFYPLDENTGTTTYDTSANANNGSLISGPTWTTGKIGSGISLDGSVGQRVSAPDSASLPSGNALTVSVWAKQSAAAGNVGLVSHWDYSGAQPVSGSWALQLTPGGTGVRFFVAEGPSDPGNNHADTSGGTWTTGTWHHVTAVFDGSKSTSYDRVKIYIDGINYGTTGGGTFPTSLQNAAAPLVIGDFLGLDRNWNGSLDHVKVYSRALTEAEVKAEYQAQNTGRESGLSLNTITPGISQIADFDAITSTNQSSYSLAISQDQDLMNGVNALPAVGGSIASPVAWSESNTKGLGFSLVTGAGLPVKWGSGNNFAALPGSATAFFSRSGFSGDSKDVVGMRLRADAAANQINGAYSNEITITGTTIP